MLAAFITVAVAAAVIGLVTLIVFVISELVPNRKTSPNTLFSDEKVEALRKDSLRQQIISFGTPVLVDTLKLKYIIPVNVKTLNEPENLNEGVLGLMDTFGEADFSSGKTYKARRTNFGNFNNLVVYDYEDNSSLKISNTRFIGSDLTYEYFDNEIIVTFLGAEKDSNRQYCQYARL